MKDIRNLTKEEKIKIIKEEGSITVFDLRWSDLRGSDLSGSDLRGAKIDETTLFSKIKIKKSQIPIIIKQMFQVEE